MSNHPLVPCFQREDWAQIIEVYAKDLIDSAYMIGTHGLSKNDFMESGLFSSAIERIRGQQAASTKIKYAFIDLILDFLKKKKFIQSYLFVGSEERHDYEVIFPNGRLCCIEAKGCMDGNNTNIFERPQNADEFVIWSLCQNPGANPRHNAWSGIHTRLSAEIVATEKRVDGVIIWDMLCNTLARKCPKVENDSSRVTHVDNNKIPPPCLFLFPRTIPDPRNNPNPYVWNLQDVHLLDVLAKAFNNKNDEIVKVGISARMSGADVQRRTTYTAGNNVLVVSKWSTIRRAK